MQRQTQIALIILAGSSSLSRAKPVMSFEAMPTIINNCDDFSIGTRPDLVDVVRQGAVRAEFMGAEFEFSQSIPHSFFMKGSVALAGNPIVYSLNSSQDDSTVEELLAFTSVETSLNMLKVEVKYSDKECRDDFELMQMDIPLADGCGTLSAQWFVICDILDKGNRTPSAYDHLHVVTGRGEVVTGDG